jgi:hypothetical protein
MVADVELNVNDDVLRSLGGQHRVGVNDGIFNMLADANNCAGSSIPNANSFVVRRRGKSASVKREWNKRDPA